MSEVKVNKISPRSGTSVTLQDSGGNTILKWVAEENTITDNPPN